MCLPGFFFCICVVTFLYLLFISISTDFKEVAIHKAESKMDESYNRIGHDREAPKDFANAFRSLQVAKDNDTSWIKNLLMIAISIALLGVVYVKTEDACKWNNLAGECNWYSARIGYSVGVFRRSALQKPEKIRRAFNVFTIELLGIQVWLWAIMVFSVSFVVCTLLMIR